MVYNNEEGERSSKERIAPAKQSAQEYNVPAGHDDRLGPVSYTHLAASMIPVLEGWKEENLIYEK